MRALISIGTNSTRLLVVDGEEPVLHEARGTRIGEGLRERGPIAGGASQRTLGAVREFVAIARAGGQRGGILRLVRSADRCPAAGSLGRRGGGLFLYRGGSRVASAGRRRRTRRRRREHRIRVRRRSRGVYRAFVRDRGGPADRTRT